MKAVSIAFALAAVLGSCTGSHAEPFPSRPVTLIVPFPAGGPTDTLARILTERMRVALGQPIVIENVTGAGASIGVVRAAQAAAGRLHPEHRQLDEPRRGWCDVSGRA